MSSNIILIIINCYFNPNYIKVMYFWQLILLLYVLKKINACLFHCIFYWVLQTYLIFSAYRSCNFLVKFITNFFYIFVAPVIFLSSLPFELLIAKINTYIFKLVLCAKLCQLILISITIFRPGILQFSKNKILSLIHYTFHIFLSIIYTSNFIFFFNYLVKLPR